MKFFDSVRMISAQCDPERAGVFCAAAVCVAALNGTVGDKGNGPAATRFPAALIQALLSSSGDAQPPSEQLTAEDQQSNSRSAEEDV